MCKIGELKMSLAKQIIDVLEKKKDPGEKKATKQVSDLQKFDFDYVEDEKEYKKYDEGSDYEAIHTVRRDLTNVSRKLEGLKRSKLKDVQAIAKEGESLIDGLRRKIFDLPEK
jgi:hypothetical protein